MPGKLTYATNIAAIRLYYTEESGATPMADIKFRDGTTVTCEWNLVADRRKFEPYIDAYTHWYDERPKRDWNEW